MNVLLLAPQPFYDERGTPIAVKWVAENLADAGHAVDLLTFPFGRDVEIPGVRILRAARPAGVRKVPIGFSFAKVRCDVHLFLAARRLMREKRYDVIHACEEAVFLAIPLARRSRAKLIYDMDSSMADQMMEKWRWLRVFRPALEAAERYALRRADLVLPVCQALADKATRLAPSVKTVLLRDMAMTFPPVAPETDNLRDAFRIDGLLALYVGNLEHYQGINLLLDGFAAANAPDLSLVIIGGRAEDVAAYRERAARMGLSNRVHFAGPRPLDRLAYYLEQADILVSPRLRGVNTPMKVYSYMLSGRAIIATNIDSHTQVLDSTCARLVAPEPAALGAALRELAAAPDERARLGAAARSRAQARHSLDAYRASLLYAYSLVSSSPGWTSAAQPGPNEKPSPNPTPSQTICDPR
jgi:glycosyltransferase involved in cell wall biosynthesis